MALAAVQLLLVIVAPSKDPGERNTALGTVGGAGGTSGSGGGTGSGGTGGTGGTGTGTAAGVGAGTGTGGGGAGGATGGTTGAAGDMRNCDENGRQIGASYYMPPCQPVWPGGDNGGATMTGVTADSINYVFYVAEGNDQVNAILATQNLATNNQDRCEALQAFHEELNKRWEFYGRHLVALDGPGNHKGSEQQDCKYPYYQGRCSLTPPDPACNRAEAAEIAAMNPAYVVAPVANGAFYNELGKRGIIVSGGAHRPAAYLADVGGYNYDLLTDGTRAASMVAEYYCKRLYGKPVQWAGPSVTNPDHLASTPPPLRKLAVLFPATDGDPTYKLSADLLIDLVSGGMCGSPSDGVKGYPYQSDINTATQQALTTAAAIKNDGATTVMCFCDPIAPAFFTAALDAQLYEPEHLIAGIGLIDYDLLGRLYTPGQWQHAFGLSELALSSAFDDSDAAVVWRDVGRPGSPADRTSNASWAYMFLMASSFQVAGPQPTPESIRAGLFGLAERGGWVESNGDQRRVLIKFGEADDDYTAISDAREIYWDPNRPSEIDGKAGSYMPVDGGRRYRSGEWPVGDPQVFPG